MKYDADLLAILNNQCLPGIAALILTTLTLRMF